MSVYITDYIEVPDVEKKILGDALVDAPSNDVKVLLAWHQNIDKEYLRQFPELMGVVRYGVGFDTIDLNEIKVRGLIFCNTPDYGTDEVSDTALAMLMQIVRGVSVYNHKCKFYTDTWQENTLSGIRRTSNVKLGVIGAGRIGTALMRKASAVGFNVVFYDPFKDSGYEKAIGVSREYAIEALLASSDVISLNLPLSESTRGMVNENFIAKMKPGASLINTARGELIENLDCLYESMKNGHLYSVGLDVLPFEPPKDEKFIEAWRTRDEFSARIIINPHTAYYSSDSFIEMREKAAKNAKRIMSGQMPLNIILDGRNKL